LLLVNTSAPVNAPLDAGTKVTLTVQLAAAAIVAPQVLLLSPKPFAVPVASTPIVSPVSAEEVPWLLTVTSTGCAACPTPVVPNCTVVAGVVPIPGGRAPAPLSAVVALIDPDDPGAPVITALAVSAPVAAPAPAGENNTPAVQLAPPFSTLVQVVFVGSSPNPAVTASCKSVIPACPEFSIVAV